MVQRIIYEWCGAWAASLGLMLHLLILVKRKYRKASMFSVNLRKGLSYSRTFYCSCGTLCIVSVTRATQNHNREKNFTLCVGETWNIMCCCYKNDLARAVPNIEYKIYETCASFAYAQTPKAIPNIKFRHIPRFQCVACDFKWTACIIINSTRCINNKGRHERKHYKNGSTFGDLQLYWTVVVSVWNTAGFPDIVIDYHVLPHYT